MSMIRPEIQALIDRGNVTSVELSELRCNSWEWEALIPAMTDEALVGRAEYAFSNSARVRSPASTYDEAIVSVYAPELVKRLKAQLLKNDEAEILGFAEGFEEAMEAGEKAVQDAIEGSLIADELLGKHSSGRNAIPSNRPEPTILEVLQDAFARKPSDIKNLRCLLSLAYPTPWVADIDDPEIDGGSWTGKFYTGSEAAGNAGTWVTYNDDRPHDKASVRLVEAAISALPELLDRLEQAEARLVTPGESLLTTDPRFGTPEHMRARWKAAGIRGPFYRSGDVAVAETAGGRTIATCASKEIAGAVIDALDAYEVAK